MMNDVKVPDDIYCRMAQCAHTECNKHPDKIPLNVPITVAPLDALGCCEGFEQRTKEGENE